MIGPISYLAVAGKELIIIWQIFLPVDHFHMSSLGFYSISYSGHQLLAVVLRQDSEHLFLLFLIFFSVREYFSHQLVKVRIWTQRPFRYQLFPACRTFLVA